MSEDYLKLLQQAIESQNAEKGDLPDLDCPICKNKGFIYFLGENNEECTKECNCMEKRRTIARTKNSGLADMLDVYTFERFNHDKPWQFRLYDKATDFVMDKKANAFFVGGAVGSGKSHICTAIAGKFLNRGKVVYFNVWNAIVTALKQAIFEQSDEYNAQMQYLKNVEVLYIDDFFKTTPTNSDIDKAFQILDYRKNKQIGGKDKARPLITIISSEKSINEIMCIDEAIGSRIFEMANHGEYVLEVAKDTNKNQRMIRY